MALPGTAPPGTQVFDLGRLANEYAIDMFSRELDARLSYIRSNQEHLRAQEQDAALMDMRISKIPRISTFQHHSLAPGVGLQIRLQTRSQSQQSMGLQRFSSPSPVMASGQKSNHVSDLDRHIQISGCRLSGLQAETLPSYGYLSDDVSECRAPTLHYPTC